ncbi:DUF2971 domain-containing protein [Chitinophaga filiformis]|uniref:DUF2971 domain-containing protein n=1 Tax=Chitinophaga filiformis TaxID=104663 RepID=UPI001F34E0B0|nr:DUF2971 domain-containing protein [Chitinophaga filiformis]MCF6404455.1 DUF2971 domain-containing protein [Chitinophaga filiformis]
MHYYRYRHGSLLSIKELMYNEIYFGSPRECNDPFDSKAFYEFPNDPVRWRRLLDQALTVQDKDFKKMLLDDLTNHMCSRSPITLEDLSDRPFFNEPPLAGRFQEQTLINMELAVRRFINTYIPPTRYFTCFSKLDSDTLMWAHYANNHRGFCLIFKAIDNKLKQDGQFKKRQIRRSTPKGITQEMTYGMPKEFEFQPIDYRAVVEPLNAFKCLSAFVYGETLSADQIDELRLEQNSHFVQKHHSWHYEKEYRLILPPPPSWLFGGHFEYTPHERLFHYAPNQLVGIIFGARMSDHEKDAITEILSDMLDRRHDKVTYPFISFDFVKFEAKLSASQREIEVQPVEILGFNGMKQGDKDFEQRYTRWKEGWGLEFSEDGRRCKPMQVM